MAEIYSYKNIWRVTYPVLLSLLVQQALGLTDAAFLGRVGEVELGASAIGSIYYLVLYMLGFGFSVGAEIVMARRNGEGNYARIGTIFFHGMVFLAVMAAAMFALSATAGPPVLKKIISSPDVYAATVEFTKWRIYGFFFSFAAIMYRAFYMAVTRTKALTAASVVMVASNIALNYILVFGKLGFPRLGIAGSAIGSSLAELIALIFYIVYTHAGKRFRIYGLFRSLRFSFAGLREVLRVSVWTMIQFVVSCGTWLFFFVAVEHLGERQLALSNMVRNLGSLLYVFVSAYAMAGSALVSNLMGEGGAAKVTSLIRRVIGMAALTIAPLLLVAVFFPRLGLGIFSNDPELIRAAVPSMHVMSAAIVALIPALVMFMAVSGTGNTRAAMLMEFAALGAYALWIYVSVFVLHADVAVCWGAEVVYNLLLLIVCTVYFRRGRWKETRV